MGEGEVVTPADVEAALIEAMRVWMWGAGRTGSPWASDGPWHLFRPAFSERWNAHDDNVERSESMARAIAAAVRAPRPDRDMISRAEQAAQWLQMIDDDIDRQVVVKVTAAFAAGRKRAPWRAILRHLGLERGIYGLQRRYARALGLVSAALNGAEKRS